MRVCVVLAALVLLACAWAFSLIFFMPMPASRTWASAELWKLDFLRIRSEPAPAWMTAQINSSIAAVPRNLSAIMDAVLSSMALVREMDIVELRIRSNAVSSYVRPGSSVMAVERAADLVRGLEALASVVRLPDTRFLVSCSDEVAPGRMVELPLFVFARDDTAPEARTTRPLLPDFEVLSGKDWAALQAVAAADALPWAAKDPRAVFRGATTGAFFTRNTFMHMPRAQAVRASLDSPECVDARFTELVQCLDNRDRLRAAFADYFGSALSVAEQLRYKFVLLIDGNSASYSRGLWTTFGGSAVIRCASSRVQWYTAELRPAEHYIPAWRNCSNVADAVRWGWAHDAHAERIARASQAFARENLRYARVLQYVELLLRHWAHVTAAVF